MCVLTFSTNLSETFLIVRRTERDVIKKYIGLHVSYPLFLSYLKNLEFSRQIFEKYSNIKFHENPSSGGPSCYLRTDGKRDSQTDRLDKANRRFSQLCKRN